MRNDSTNRYSVVVPFFNEQENIPPLYMKITEVMDAIGEPYELVFVDDGSKDRTCRLLEEIAAVDSRVLVVKLRRNFGQTSALAAGFAVAAASNAINNLPVGLNLGETIPAMHATMQTSAAALIA